MDSRNYADSWNAASATFARTIAGAPEREYVTVIFKSSLETKDSGIETVTSVVDVDGTGRVCGYYIR